MQITLSGHHVEVTPALRTYVAGKLERIERHFDHVTDIKVILSVEKQRQKAEATINAGGASLYADAVEADMYAAIDALSDKLDRQIRRHKERLTDHHRAQGALKNQKHD
ncbi:MAG: ribosome-associated translation inhibitor RaiA [Gammaproteobacteria bacterium]|nr:MAG: ribosome-associated translation inhibitor RaiA [Gammaproteobacteria bacterium]